ncbi:MAG: hypothetical protein ACKVP6_12115 [Mycobacterium sp.]
MGRLTNHALRAGASAMGVAAGLMVLASTSQTPDGFTRASFDGPLDIFGNSAPEPQSDVLAIGSGTGGASELAAILNGPLPAGSPNSPFQEAFAAGVGPNSLEVSAIPSAIAASGATTSKQALTTVPYKPVVDAQGRVDCTGSVSCLIDPNTNVTTVTYPDGVVALVQQINDMTVVAYKTVTESLKNDLQALLPIPAPHYPLAAAVPAAAQSPEMSAQVIDPGPSAAPVAPDISASTIRPRVVVTPSPQDLNPGQNGQSVRSGSITIPAVKPTSPIDVVKDAFNSVVNAVTGHHSPSQTANPNDPTPDPPGHRGARAGRQ